jgi:hypothetical protein
MKRPRSLVVVCLVAGLVVLAAGSARSGVASAARAPRTGKSGGRVKLSLLPLPESVIGSAAKSLSLQSDSGAAPNEGALRRGFLLTPTHAWDDSTGPTFRKLGRISGYVLDYGLGASGGAGVTEVWTSVDEYKTSADARKGLSAWNSVDQHGFAHYDRIGPGLAVSHTAEKIAAVGSRGFAFLVGFSAANIAPVFAVDEQFSEGHYEAEVMVWAGTAAGVKTLAPRLAKKLDARIKLALAGRLHARPVKLPALPKPGPPPGGPDLTALVLQTSDVGGPATALGTFYTVDWGNPTAVSDLTAGMDPAGAFDEIRQQIEWCPTANQASFAADLSYALGLERREKIPLERPIDLSGVGDGAQGFIGALNEGKPGQVGSVIFSTGRLFESLSLFGHSSPEAPQVQGLAQTAADYINAADLGG